MEVVTLKVKVENSELKKLQADVDKLKGQNIVLRTDGLQGLQKSASSAAQSINALNAGMVKTSQTWKDGELVKSIDTVVDAIGREVKFTTRIGTESVSVTKTVTESFQKQRREIEKNRSAYEKLAQAARDASAASHAWQKSWNAVYAGSGNRINSSNSLLAAMSDSEFNAYNPKASTSAYQEAWNVVYAGSGNKINKNTSVFAGLSDEAFEKYTSGIISAEEAMKGYGQSTKTAAKESYLLGDSIGKIVLKMAAWQILGTAISKVIGSFREAVNTMKEVDTQLTNIQKVSNLTAAELEKVGESAYTTASKYGVAVDEYLSSFYEMQKAGLGESAGDMAELATKTMLVGDTTADVANKFLIGVNAAWGMNGAMSELSKVVDETDLVNNRYATTLEKMADGMPIVASSAANMNMSFEETLALLATINSKTQETGRKTATAVRSFLIAISGQVGEFVDDTGETYEVTTENIEALTDALKLYGNEAVQSAIQTGQIINPMEALNSLAQAYKDGLIDDISLQEMLIKVAGKMRYNQLVTIVKDLASESSTYREILEQLPEAAGTADAEIGVMLSSWESKTQILSNTWAQFISHMVNTEAVKTALGALTVSVKALDTELGRSVITLGAVETAIVLVSKIVKWFIATAIPAIKTALSGMTVTMGAVAAVYILIKAVDALTVSLDEQRQKVEDLSDKVKQLSGEYSALSEKNNRTDEENHRLELLEKELEIQERLLAVQKQKLFAKEWEGSGSGVSTYQETKEELEIYNSLQEERAEITEKILSLTDEEANKLPKLTQSLQDVENKIVSSEEELLKAYQNLSQYDEETIRSAKNGDDLVRMLEELEKTLGLTSTFEVKAKKAAEDHTDAMLEEKYQAGETGKALYDLVAAEIAADSANMTFTQQIAALKRLAQEAGIAGNALLSIRALDNYAVSKAQIDGYKRTHPGATTEQAQQALLADAWRSMTSSAGNSASYSYGASGAGDNAAERAQDRQREAEQSSLNAEKKRMEAQRDAEIAAIDAQIDELKKQHQAQEDANDLAEKQLAVEKAQEDLLRVQNERNVRFYNQTTGQWEWVANSVDVIKAEQAVADAQRALAEEEAQQAYEAQLAVLEAQKEGLQAYWSNAIASIDAAVEALLDKISDIDTNITVNTTVNTNVSGGSSSSKTSTTTSTSRPTVQKPSDSANSGVSGSYQSYLDNKNKKIEQYTDTGTGGSGKYTSSGGRTFGGGGGKIVAEKYDSGGILHGLGGIKATQEDEIVLPPDVTRRLLNPDRSSLYATALDTMRFMTKGEKSVAGTTDNRIGRQHNGNVYQLGGITISEGQAKTMTVYDLARLSRNLTLFKS